jgi:demethylmenaquinone methyltransferase/2-methoxy-6-polyprenyl-1,4-benzoquinol methylase
MGYEKLTGQARAEAVRDVFRRIAPRYDLMNRVMTLGQDQSWRRYVIRKIQLPAGGKMLDIATGTGDLAFEAMLQQPGVTTVGVDFAPMMMIYGQKRPAGDKVKWAAGDALNLPFPDNTFDAITHGYLVRNVIDIPRAFAEQFRALKPGGRLAFLETTPPRDDLLKPFITVYLREIIPMIGTLLTGQTDAYSYLPNSTLGFRAPDEIVALLKAAGFVEVGYRTFMFNTMAVHWARKP